MIPWILIPPVMITEVNNLGCPSKTKDDPFSFSFSETVLFFHPFVLEECFFVRFMTMVIKRSNGISTICMICYFLLKLLAHKNLGSFHFSKIFAKKRRNLEQQQQQQHWASQQTSALRSLGSHFSVISEGWMYWGEKTSWVGIPYRVEKNPRSLTVFLW